MILWVKSGSKVSRNRKRNYILCDEYRDKFYYVAVQLLRRFTALLCMHLF